jgi:hypothetical protein
LVIGSSLFPESVMGNSLHNKIDLGRSSLLGSRRLRSLLALTLTVGIGLALMAFRSLK